MEMAFSDQEGYMRREYEEELYSLLCDIWEYSETAFEEIGRAHV